MLKLCTAVALSLCIAGVAHGQVPDPEVCKRTQQVQDAIVDAVADAGTCSEVTSAQLATVTVLNLGDQSIATLQSGDFADLPDLVNINLTNNDLQTLPADIFDDIVLKLGTFIDLRGNPFGEGLPPEVVRALKSFRNGLAVVRLNLVTVQNILPAEPLVLSLDNPSTNLDLEDAFFYADGRDIRDPASTYTVTADDNSVARTALTGSHTLTITALGMGLTDIEVTGRVGSRTARHSLAVLVGDIAVPEPPVCNRTPAVRDEILFRLGVSNCDEVSGVQLATLSGLSLEDAGITELRSGDFAGLTHKNLQIHLDNNQLQTLPADIFDSLPTNALLRLDRNPFRRGLPSAVVDDLKMRGSSVSLDLVFVQDILPTAPLELTVGDATTVDLEDAFFYARATNDRKPADSYEITVTNPEAATTQISGHTLMITALSAGQTDIVVAGEAQLPLIGIDGFIQSKATQSFTVTTTESPTENPTENPTESPTESTDIIFRIKVFLEGAQ